MANITVTIDKDQFLNTCKVLPAETIDDIAEAFPAVFSGCFVFGGETEATHFVNPKPAKEAAEAKPRERKPRAAKDDAGAANCAAEVLAFMQADPRARPSGDGIQSKDIVPGLDNKRRGIGLDLLEREGKARHNGKPAGGRRWFLCAGDS